MSTRCVPSNGASDPWAMQPTMAVGTVIVCLVCGLALPLSGEVWGLLFLVLVPLFAWAGVRGWRRGFRF
jgi:hypothetical protein